MSEWPGKSERPGGEFGPLLKTFREKYRPLLSQERLAEKSGYDRSYVSRLESGARNPTRDAVERLAEAMALDPVERDQLLVSAGFIGSQPVITPEQLREARSHLASALVLLGGATL